MIFSKETHNLNRNNSFNDIDIDYFVENYAQQGVKMTLSEHSLPNLAKDIKYIHSLGFKRIGGVNLAEGPFDFGKEEFVKILIPQLTEIVDFYVENPDVQINQMLDKYLHLCETYAHENEKRCGIGDRVIFFDTDGSRYPCPFVTPMIFSKEKIAEICRTNFSNSNCFLDVECDSNCYISSICPSCAASNYLNNNSFAIRDKRHCRIYKLIALFTADLNAKLISKYPNMVDDNFIYYTILAINKIKEIYLPEFMEYF
jgi:hypothetical protein